ncbi:hypothetical protein HMN09_00397700 [Mycena chlorophos]|uniref:DUF6534 domain-containing protein n=1 Tax=Mycena chlorophos TaxID=658473 RepID=A0A8H6TFM3_MYCCL|nr:hypothetical protein HMN09_00397700 [Mycena chlorophos]
MAVTLLFGPMLLGVILNALLYGVMVSQMVTYWGRYPNDMRGIRFFILYLFVVETVVVVVTTGIVWQPLIVEYGQPSALTVSPHWLPADSLLIVLVATPIQLFTAWRIRIITKSWIAPVCISLLSLVSLAGGLLLSFSVQRFPDFSSFDQFSDAAILWLVSSAVCDIVLAGGMGWALLSRKTLFDRQVDGYINRMARLSIQSGGLTAAAALLDLILFLTFPRTALNFSVDFPLSTLYTCSLLALLNARTPRTGTTVKLSGSTLAGPGATQPSLKISLPSPTHSMQSMSEPIAVSLHHAMVEGREKESYSHRTSMESRTTFDSPIVDHEMGLARGLGMGGLNIDTNVAPVSTADSSHGYASFYAYDRTPTSAGAHKRTFEDSIHDEQTRRSPSPPKLKLAPAPPPKRKSQLGSQSHSLPGTRRNSHSYTSYQSHSRRDSTDSNTSSGSHSNNTDNLRIQLAAARLQQSLVPVPAAPEPALNKMAPLRVQIPAQPQQYADTLSQTPRIRVHVRSASSHAEVVSPALDASHSSYAASTHLASASTENPFYGIGEQRGSMSPVSTSTSSSGSGSPRTMKSLPKQKPTPAHIDPRLK